MLGPSPRSNNHIQDVVSDVQRDVRESRTVQACGTDFCKMPCESGTDARHKHVRQA